MSKKWLIGAIALNIFLPVGGVFRLLPAQRARLLALPRCAVAGPRDRRPAARRVARRRVLLLQLLREHRGQRRTRLETEIALAGEIHRVLVPSIDRSWNGWDIAGLSASGEMGGDLIDFRIDRRLAQRLLMDVSGHGVKAGVVMALLKGSARDDHVGPGHIARFGDEPLRRSCSNPPSPACSLPARGSTSGRRQPARQRRPPGPAPDPARRLGHTHRRERSPLGVADDGGYQDASHDLARRHADRLQRRPERSDRPIDRPPPRHRAPNRSASAQSARTQQPTLRRSAGRSSNKSTKPAAGPPTTTT